MPLMQRNIHLDEALMDALIEAFTDALMDAAIDLEETASGLAPWIVNGPK